MSPVLRILGIDPGSQVAGFAVLEAPVKAAYLPRDFRVIEAGALEPKGSLSLFERTGHMHEAMFALAHRAAPHVCVIEKAFVGVNAGTAMKLGEARGALVSAVRRLHVPVEELTPTTIKKTVTGQGHATKQQVAEALRLLLRFERGNLPFDVSDAVAIALCFGMLYHQRRLEKKVAPARKKSHDATW